MSASYTNNFNLKKPAPTDNYNIEDANGNMDLIDLALKEHSTQLNAKANKYDGNITDFNSATEPGIYSFNSTAVNGYKSNIYGVLRVYYRSSDPNSIWIYQIAYLTAGEIVYRYKINNDSWSTWTIMHYPKVNTLTLQNGWTQVDKDATIAINGRIATVNMRIKGGVYTNSAIVCNLGYKMQGSSGSFPVYTWEGIKKGVVNINNGDLQCTGTWDVIDSNTDININFSYAIEVL